MNVSNEEVGLGCLRKQDKRAISAALPYRVLLWCFYTAMQYAELSQKIADASAKQGRRLN